MQQTITNTKSVNKLTYSKHTEQTPMLRPILTDSIWSTHFVAMTLVCLHQLRPYSLSGKCVYYFVYDKTQKLCLHLLTILNKQ